MSPETDQVMDAMKATGIEHYDLIEALLLRGHSVEAIQRMSPRKRLDEYLVWHGMIGWTGSIISAGRAAGLFRVVADG